MFRRLGGRVELLAITRAFYDKVYRHRWLSKFFAYVDQDHIARQQADFMAGVLGGRRIYAGRTPGHAHPHIAISHEAFDLRQALLRETLVERAAPADIREHWLGLDEAFRRRLVKTRDQCVIRPGIDRLIDPPR